MKKIMVVITIFNTLLFSFNYFSEHNLSEFKNFKIYKPNMNSYFLKSNLNMPKGKLSQEQIKKLIYIYQKEKMIRDMLLILNEKYHYEFMPYIAMLTQKHISILNLFFKKYTIPIPKWSNIVGKFEIISIDSEYNTLLIDSLKDKKSAANLSVKFMKELIDSYDDLIDSGLPRDLKRELLKLNAFNKKVLRKFKKGLRNIEIGLPID